MHSCVLQDQLPFQYSVMSNIQPQGTYTSTKACQTYSGSIKSTLPALVWRPLAKDTTASESADSLMWFWGFLWFSWVCMCKIVGWHSLQDMHFWPLLLMCRLSKHPKHIHLAFKNYSYSYLQVIRFGLKYFTYFQDFCCRICRALRMHLNYWLQLGFVCY